MLIIFQNLNLYFLNHLGIEPANTFRFPISIKTIHIEFGQLEIPFLCSRIRFQVPMESIEIVLTLLESNLSNLSE